jgi:hypothetical protein
MKHANFGVNRFESFRSVTGQSSLFAIEKANGPYNVAYATALACDHVCSTEIGVGVVTGDSLALVWEADRQPEANRPTVHKVLREALNV